MQTRHRLTIAERKKLDSFLGGHSDINSKEGQIFINRPHVGVALEALLDMKGLSDDKLVSRLRTIINRTPEKSLKTGTSNISSIDANALNTIRTIWQVKGKFTEKHEHKHSGLSDLPEEQLDKIIDSGMEYLRIRKVGSNGASTDTGRSGNTNNT